MIVFVDVTPFGRKTLLLGQVICTMKSGVRRLSLSVTYGDLVTDAHIKNTFSNPDQTKSCPVPSVPVVFLAADRG